MESVYKNRGGQVVYSHRYCCVRPKHAVQKGLVFETNRSQVVKRGSVIVQLNVQYSVRKCIFLL